MGYTDQQLESMFRKDFPEQVQEAFIKCLFSSYQTAYDECSHFPDDLAKDLRGYYRWIQLRAEIRGLGDRYNNLECISEQYHTLIVAGRFKLVACSNRDPGAPLRTANYRLAYAEKSLNLFDPNPASMSDEDYIFTILEHGVDCLHPCQPSFSRVLFMTKEMKVAYDFDLFARFKTTVSSLSVPLNNANQSPPDIRLRKFTKQESI